MFVNISPEAESLQETICSLRFATKVNVCQTAARGGARKHVSLTGDHRGSYQVSLQPYLIPFQLLRCALLKLKFQAVNKLVLWPTSFNIVKHY